MALTQTSARSSSCMRCSWKAAEVSSCTRPQGCSMSCSSLTMPVGCATATCHPTCGSSAWLASRCSLWAATQQAARPPVTIIE
eukprot:1813176-Lingulodinium_polyedra.AAC.1